MHLELLIPDLIAPDAAASAGLALPALEKLLGRGRRRASAPVIGEQWLVNAAGLVEEAPVAAVSALGDGIQADSTPLISGWLRADPVSVRAERDQLILDDLAAATLTREEAEQLIATLNHHFAEDGMHFTAATPRKWYVGTPAVPKVRLASPAAVVAAGNNVDALRPQGEDAMVWQRFTNEAQMLLHEHPVNQAREERGLAPVNSVWFWGAGAQPLSVAWPFTRVASDDALARGFAILAKTSLGTRPENAAAWLATAGGADKNRELVTLDALREAVSERGVEAWREALTAMERGWFAPLLQALQSERIGMLSIHAPSPRCTLHSETIRGDLLKFWRRARPLAAYAKLEAEAAD